jgi:hypothetical protein
MKNSSDIIKNRTRDLPACSAVPQPTALPRAPSRNMNHIKAIGFVPILIYAICNSVVCTSDNIKSNCIFVVNNRTANDTWGGSGGGVGCDIF